MFRAWLYRANVLSADVTNISFDFGAVNGLGMRSLPVFSTAGFTDAWIECIGWIELTVKLFQL